MKLSDPRYPPAQLRKMLLRYPALVLANPNCPPDILQNNHCIALWPHVIAKNPALDLLLVEDPARIVELRETLAYRRALRQCYRLSTHSEAGVQMALSEFLALKYVPLLYRSIQRHRELTQSSETIAGTHPHRLADRFREYRSHTCSTVQSGGDAGRCQFACFVTMVCQLAQAESPAFNYMRNIFSYFVRDADQCDPAFAETMIQYRAYEAEVSYYYVADSLNALRRMHIGLFREALDVVGPMLDERVSEKEMMPTADEIEQAEYHLYLLKELKLNE